MADTEHSAELPYNDPATWTGRMSAKAAKKTKLKGWQGWIFSKVVGGLTVHGAVCPPITRGKRKGMPNIRKADRRTIRLVYLSSRECK